MQYLKNAELADRFHVSERTVNNWITAARNGRLDLKLYQQADKSYIANTTQNLTTLELLVKQRRKYLNTKAHKIVTPKSTFYKLYSNVQIFDIIENIDIHREIPRQYSYFAGGADLWDKYVNSLAEEEFPNLLTNTVLLVDANKSYLDLLLSKYKRVNVVDVGVGNALPVRDLLTYLHQKGVMGRYIGIDIAKEMLRIAERNLTKWFEEKIVFEGYIRDITHEWFKDLLVEESLGDEDQTSETINLVLLFGGTLANLRSSDEAMKVIYNSMRRHDLFMYIRKLDSETARRHFSLSNSTDTKQLPRELFMLDLLNINESYYETVAYFDEKQKTRFLGAQLNVALTLDFELEGGHRYLTLGKGETIKLWRATHQSAEEINQQLYRNGFNILHTSQTPDHEYMLAIADIRAETK